MKISFFYGKKGNGHRSYPLARVKSTLVAAFLFGFLFAGCISPAPRETLPEYQEVDGYKVAARTGEQLFEVYRQGTWSPLVVKGVNLGTALPGKFFTWFPQDREVYRGWLEAVAALNANTIRLYTLLDPLFYQVFLEYNRLAPPGQELWLLQEIWPEEEVPGDDYFEPGYMAEYREEIRLAIDALHGSADIPGRRGRAYGTYRADVSPYVLGILIGRELEPHEVILTDELNPHQDNYEGEYFQARAGSSATEVWLAKMCDYTLDYAGENYGWQYPVSFVSWPTLDPLDHPAEWNILGDRSLEYNDYAEVDPNHFRPGPGNRAGIFASYHIYPNYPDFMNNEPSYDEYRDEEGIFRYGAYLRDFMAIHPPYPALVAEFGMATGMATAHVHPQGMDHGGMTEREQGEMTVRMMEAILREGYAGGVIFALMDEWVKKTWLTEPFMVPYERNVYWHNALCPEQNYGLVAMEPDRRPFLEGTPLLSQGPLPRAPAGAAGDGMGLREIWVDHNEAFLFVRLALDREKEGAPGAGVGDGGDRPFLSPGEGLLLGLDTLGPGRGTGELPLAGEQAPGGLEFVILITGEEDGCLLVTSSYNRAALRFSSPVYTPGREAGAGPPGEGAPGTGGDTGEGGTALGSGDRERWETVRPLVNRERVSQWGQVFPAIYSNESRLRRGNYYPEAGDYDSRAALQVDRDRGWLELRLPWALLNFSDPSTRQVIDDGGLYRENPLRDTLQVSTSPGVSILALSFLLEGGGGITCQEIKEGLSPGELGARVWDYLPRQEGGAGFARELPFYTWDFWEEPGYQARFKESFPIISEYFAQIP